MGAGRFGLVDIGHEKNFAAIAFGPGAGVGKLLTLKITSVSPSPWVYWNHRISTKILVKSAQQKT
jgi:hypothetical protein